GYTIWLAMVVYCFLMPIMVLRLPADLGNEEQQPLWTRERRLAMTLLISQVGFYACAFFLSRSYVILLYILLGLVTGWYAGARERWAGLPAFRFRSDWFKWCVLSVVSVIVLWVVVKILFVLAGA
ncbi:MAG: O-antigen polymerase, partial [Luteimonas sp.]|nr:O-antigen polymerase [Luteimonas sp.]